MRSERLIRKLLEHQNPPLIRDCHGFCVVIRVSQVYCAFRVLGLSRDAKYLTFGTRLVPHLSKFPIPLNYFKFIPNLPKSYLKTIN